MRWTPSKWLGRIAIPMLAATTVLSAQTQTPQSQTTFRGRSDYVTTDVIVRDSRGQFVPNLRPEDFEVLEDGVLQTITHFEPIIPTRSRLQNRSPTGSGRGWLSFSFWRSSLRCNRGRNRTWSI